MNTTKLINNTFQISLILNLTVPTKSSGHISMKKQSHDLSGVPSLIKDGITISDDYVKANKSNDYFTSVFTKEDTTQIPTMTCNSYPDLPPVIVTHNGVLQLLSDLHPNKASGPDKLPSRQLAKNLAPMLT